MMKDSGAQEMAQIAPGWEPPMKTPQGDLFIENILTQSSRLFPQIVLLFRNKELLWRTMSQ